MAFRELRGTGGSNFFKWPDKKYGTEFVGQFKALATGMFEGRTTFHAIFTDAQGKNVQVNTPTILRGKLAEVEAGEFVRAVYTNDLPGKGGKRGAKDFDVFAGSSLAEVTAQPVQAAPQAQAVPAQQVPLDQAAAFAAFLAAQKAAQAPAASPYEALIAKLKAQDPKGSEQLIKALEQIYPDAAAREKALADHLKAQGVAV